MDVSGFREEARRMLAGQVAPDQIAWHARAGEGLTDAVAASASRPAGMRAGSVSVIPRSFIRLTELVVLHRDEQRFDLLYRLLWQLVHEPQLRAGAHPALAQATSMAQAVRRDIYKMRLSLRLRPIGEVDGVPLLFAWYEPVHRIAEEVGRWLSAMQADGRWLLATPERCILWDGQRLLCGPGLPAQDRPAPDDDAGWREAARRMAGQAGACAAAA
jgi:probable DNA metabolism protein